MTTEADLFSRGWGTPAAALCQLDRSAASRLHPLVGATAEETIEHACDALAAAQAVVERTRESGELYEPALDGAARLLDAVRDALRFEQVQVERTR